MTQKDDDRLAVIGGGHELDAVGAAQASREIAQVQASFTLAMRFPRNEDDSRVKILAACDRVSFADRARYVFPRGNQQVEGLSVDFAREAARLWRNVESGYRVVSADGDRVTIEGFATDLEANVRYTSSVSIRRLIYRRDRGWIEPDERDLRELVARNGAIVQRNAILSLLPADVVEQAELRAKRTLVKDATSGDRKKHIEILLSEFDKIGVTQDDIEARLRGPITEIKGSQIVELRGIYKAIRDGQAKKTEFFDSGAPRKEGERSGTSTRDVSEETGTHGAPESEDKLEALAEKLAGDLDADAKAKGFESAEERTRLIKRIDFGTKTDTNEDALAEYEEWTREDGSKSGLEALLRKFGKKATKKKATKK